MEIIGSWKIDEALRYQVSDTGVTQVWQKAAGILADESIDEDDKTMLRAEIAFTEDGKVQWILPLPENVSQEEIDEAAAAGELTLLDDGRFVVEEKEWKEEDGKVMYNTGVKGEVFGEEVSPWIELKENNGTVEIMTYRIVKL